jgi:hypothetical protein
VHDFRGGAAGAEKAGHEFEAGLDVVEEVFVGGAEILEAGVAVEGGQEEVIGTFAAAVLEYFTAAAVRREAAAFGGGEAGLRGAVNQCCQGVASDVAVKKLGVDIMVTRIDVAVVFHGQGAATGLAEDTESSRPPVMEHPQVQCSKRVSLRK